MYNSKDTLREDNNIDITTSDPRDAAIAFYVAPRFPLKPAYRITFTSSSLYCVILAHRYSSLCNSASPLLD